MIIVLSINGLRFINCWKETLFVLYKQLNKDKKNALTLKKTYKTRVGQIYKILGISLIIYIPRNLPRENNDMEQKRK